ncbi:50S ribosomal protein L2 [Enterobacteriaceae endosymbiont of Macroplea mutica]|uniref:50S ribosomal protein L2 n=1 Tax=Enterobacteriaceae endosymbiont of Macroplea mutica TaxID=2675791 RepID=UPI001448CE6F|nr:50S ribosomal protein L2 [Enterobacteriaceae endosymbiont of Macroplea mutica]QJC31296.1 50S ribosomal protein L2 [Enterobacteriaceae endosymbiont of Macroplea mutica]
MIIKKYKPTSPGRRHMVKIKSSFLYKGAPYKLKTEKKSKTGGRNNNGRITTRHIGGGHKQVYRIIDFKRNKDNIIGTIERIEYDPNRTSHIALIIYADGERRYILLPKNCKTGDIIQSGDNVDIRYGNALPIKNIPIGTILHNIEIKPGKGGQIARSAGSYVQLIAREDSYVSIRLRSGEIRKIQSSCRGTIGEVSNNKHMLRSFGKAGAKRWVGIRPTVRGTAMNPIDHPHGGGEGKNFGKHPVTPWGKQTKGKKTRKNKKTEKYIIKHRHK